MEKTIKLKEIDHTKENVDEAIGMTEEEFSQCIKEITSYPDSMFKEKVDKLLGFKREEIIEAIKNSGSEIESIVSLWQGRKEEITLYEFTLTLVLIRKTIIEQRKESLGHSPGEQLMRIVTSLSEKVINESAESANNKLKNLIEENGTKVLENTPACEKWKKEHNNSSEGCPGHLGCAKLYILTDLLGYLSSHPARFAKNPIQNAIWVNAVVETFTIVTKILAAKDLDELDKNLKDVGIVQERKTEIRAG
jgi:hypothetical protein